MEREIPEESLLDCDYKSTSKLLICETKSFCASKTLDLTIFINTVFSSQRTFQSMETSFLHAVTSQTPPLSEIKELIQIEQKSGCWVCMEEWKKGLNKSTNLRIERNYFNQICLSCPFR